MSRFRRFTRCACREARNDHSGADADCPVLGDLDDDAVTKTEVIALQREINDTCGFKLTVDGIYGPATAEAYQYYINQLTPRRVNTPVPPAPKPWWQSRAIWGLIATIVAGVAQRYGYEVDSEGLTNVLLQIIEVGGLALAVFGTVRRTASIDSSLVAPGLRLPGRSSGVPPQSKTNQREDLFTH